VRDHEINEEVVRKANLEFYDRTAFEYSIHEPVVFPWKSRVRVQRVLGKIGRRGCRGRALEIGCGLGFVTRYAERAFDRAYGIDLSREMARRAAERGHRVVIADGSRVPFLAETFDAVICYSVLHHFFDYRGVLEEAARVLKKGGYLYIDWDPNIGFTTSASARLYRWISRGYVSLKRVLGLLDESEAEPSAQATDFGEEVDRLARLAEFHHHYTPGVDPSHLTGLLNEIGFEEIKLYYHDDYMDLRPRLDRDIPLRLLGLLVGLATLKLRPSYLKWLAVVARKG